MQDLLADKIRKIALELAEAEQVFQTGDVQERLQEKPARQYVGRVLRKMATDGNLAQAGKGRGAGYSHPSKKDVLNKVFTKRLENKDLEEHIVFDRLKASAQFLAKLKENVFSIYDYAFQEMLNNAIDHSKSKTITVSTQQHDGELLFEIKDSGVGIFANISNKLKLDGELAAIGELMKGKTTTDPDNHTGEGIYFTSKAADVFVLESHGLRLIVDNKLSDVFVEELSRRQEGTRVRFSIDIKSKRHLSEIFRKYQTDPEDHAFNQTEIRVKLFTIGSVYVSRSQARRLMAGLDKKFKTVILDFDKVQTIGQAFADEIFRVYRNRHPEMVVRAVSTVPAVQFMIDRAEANTKE